MIPFYKSKFDPIAQKNILNQMYITISWIEYIIELISSISKFRDVFAEVCKFINNWRTMTVYARFHHYVPHITRDLNFYATGNRKV